MIAGQLEIQMLTNMAALSDQMRGVQSTVSGAMEGVEKAVGQAKSALQALGVGLSVNMFVGMIQGAVDAMDKLNDLSKTTGVSVENLSGLKLAAKQAGGDLDSIAASIGKLSVNMGKDAEKFAQLGITAKDPLEAFKQLADVFVSIEDPQKRAAMAADALGKSWQGAAPLLAEGSKNIQDMVDKGIKLAGVTQEMASQADAFNDKLAELEAASSGTKMKLAQELLPAMTSIATAMGDAYQEGGKLHAIWVALGGLGAFMYTDEFKTAAQQVKSLNSELAILYEQKKAQEQTPQFGFVHRWLYGENYVQDEIDKTTGAIKKLQDQIDAGMIGAALRADDAKQRLAAEQALNKAMAEAAAALAAKEAATKAAQAAQEAAKKAQDSFIANLQKEHDTLLLGTEQSKLNQAATLGITGAKLKLVETLLEEDRAYKEAIKSSKDRTDLRSKESAGIEAYMVSLTASNAAAVKGSQDALEAAQREYDQFGLTKSQIEEITLARLKDQLLTKTAGTEAYDSVSRQIEAQASLIGVLQKGEARDIAIRYSHEVATAWDHASKQIGDGLSGALTDALMNGRSLWDAFKNYLINTILDGMIKNALSSVIQGALNGFSGSLSSLVSGALGSFSTSVAGATAGAGTAAGTAAAAGTVGSLLGSSAMGTLDIAGVSIGSAGAGTAAAGATTATATTETAAAAGATSLGASAVAFVPYLAAAVAALAVGEALLFNDQRPFEVAGSGALTGLALTRQQETESGWNTIPISNVTFQKLKFTDDGSFAYQIFGDGIPLGGVSAAEFVNTYHGPQSAVSFHGTGGTVAGATDYAMTDIMNLLSSFIDEGYDADTLIGAGLSNYGLSETDIRLAGRTAGLPGFRFGGYHAGGLRIVGEDGPELEATGPSRIFNAEQTASMLRSGGASSDEVVQELRLLRAALERSNENTQSSADSLKGRQSVPLLVQVVTV